MTRPAKLAPKPAAKSPPPRAQLAEFLRTRRERLAPEAVGLTAGPRRRARGLRREEVAQLAGVGVSWYTWLEQGRDIHASEPLLERLAQALRLGETERAHLFELAHGRPAARRMQMPTEVGPTLQRMLDAHPFPAVAATARWDILAWNRAAAVLYGDFGARAPAFRNSLWSAFMDPRMRAMRPDWLLWARQTVARFRVDAARAADRREFDALAGELARVSPDFARLCATTTSPSCRAASRRSSIPRSARSSSSTSRCCTSSRTAASCASPSIRRARA